MHRRLHRFIEIHKSLYSLQLGFQENNSIDHALGSLTDAIRNTLDNKRFGCGIFMDLQKAFDTVNHNILLSKLEYYGIRGCTLQWFRSYLADRKQTFYREAGRQKIQRFNTLRPFGLVSSSECDFDSDRKQYMFLLMEVILTYFQLLEVFTRFCTGFITFPHLYQCYLPNASKRLTFYLFADDTNIYYESKDLANLTKTVNNELRLVKKWLDANKLSLNIDKTNYIIFHSSSSKVPSGSNIKIGKKQIKRVKFVKFLGILLDEHLSWKYHLSELAKKLARTYGMFFKIRNLLPLDVLVCLYNALFMSLLQYGLIVWGETYAS